MTNKIGFMGLGIMGSAMAGNLLKAGFPVTVYNRSRQNAEPLAGQGATVAAHPRELAESSDIIIAMVTGPEALDELLWGTDGAAEAFTANKIFINMSTVSPVTPGIWPRKLNPPGSLLSTRRYRAPSSRRSREPWLY